MAELAAKALEVSLARQQFGLEEVDTRAHIPLSEFAKIYLEYSRTNKPPSTVEVDRQALKQFQKVIGDKLITNIEPFDFPGPSGNKYYITAWTKRFKRLVREAELDDGYTLHTLRHTFATHLREKGTGLDALAELLGHTNIETTRIYGHLTPCIPAKPCLPPPLVASS